MPTTLFVYGTLKRGQANHGLVAGERFVGAAVTAPGYRVFDLGPYPGLVPDAADGLAVRGELWEVSAGTLAELDAFEGDGFARRPVEVPGVAGGVEAYFYTGRPDGPSGAEWPGS